MVPKVKMKCLLFGCKQLMGQMSTLQGEIAMYCPEMYNFKWASHSDFAERHRITYVFHQGLNFNGVVVEGDIFTGDIDIQILLHS